MADGGWWSIGEALPDSITHRLPGGGTLTIRRVALETTDGGMAEGGGFPTRHDLAEAMRRRFLGVSLESPATVEAEKERARTVLMLTPVGQALAYRLLQDVGGLTRETADRLLREAGW